MTPIQKQGRPQWNCGFKWARCWPHIRFGYGLVMVAAPSRAWGAENWVRIRTRYMLSPGRDLDRLALALDGVHAIAGRKRAGMFDQDSRALMLWQFGRTIAPRDILSRPVRALDIASVGLALKLADKKLREHSASLTRSV